MRNKTVENTGAGETIALRMLAFLAGDMERLQAFLATTGFELANLRQLASDPQFLAGVADYVLADQSLLLAFCENAGISPDSAVRARQQLPGAGSDL